MHRNGWHTDDELTGILDAEDRAEREYARCLETDGEYRRVLARAEAASRTILLETLPPGVVERLRQERDDALRQAARLRGEL